ncbi:hypothetical protein [Caproiciproducens sp. MSJ-32]|uniref:hypothetical protein n=1 Tax=Caproiciproducens sp. MSJ-32 TaxID=2841527 RepID=UPI001C120342|nr:hypothetical protein [Caproiciproducens sp. MSJ-32]MBU5454070.1 hypothetical protein [Caproiciproducens sp. MSJ-32]
MKKSILKLLMIIFTMILFISCSNSKSEISKAEKEKIKETIDLVLSYDKGYDEKVSKHISGKNFYICNYVEFYSLYIGELELKEYNSEMLNISKDKDGLYKAALVLNMRAEALEVHEGEEEGSDEAIGENVPVEVILSLEKENYYIKSFTEYENLEKAKELSEMFR